MATCTILYKTLHRKYLRLALKQPIKKDTKAQGDIIQKDTKAQGDIIQKDTKAQGDIILQIANFITVQCNH
jgi:hypothetical protein